MMEFYDVKKNSGFRMEGYHVWCGSAVKYEGKYYLFASRWKKEKEFPDGYMTDSEIVMAVSDSLDQPFEFKKVIISKREGGFWDSTMAHNPYIVKTGNRYVLYYIGSSDGSMKNRKIGYAYTDDINGEWIRSDKALELKENANNPAVIKTKDDRFLLYFRDGNLKVSVAESDRFSGEYKILKYDLFDKGQIEDMFIYHDGKQYVMLCEDAEGAYTGSKKAGVRFVSEDGINFIFDSAAYGFEISYEDGETMTLQRRERPYILFDEGKEYLFTSAKINGKDRLTGGDTWNMVQQIKKESRIL